VLLFITIRGRAPTYSVGRTFAPRSDDSPWFALCRVRREGDRRGGHVSTVDVPMLDSWSAYTSFAVVPNATSLFEQREVDCIGRRATAWNVAAMAADDELGRPVGERDASLGVGSGHKARQETADERVACADRVDQLVGGK